MSEKKATSLDRRDFFRKVGLGAGVAAATATATAAQAAPEQAPDKGSGYRETDHVKTFYKLARF